MLLRISSTFRVTIRRCFIRDGIYYWQRRVPKDLADRYGNASKMLKVNLQTFDPSVAARKIERLTAEYESLWDAMRGNASFTPAQVRSQAEALLKKWGLEPYSQKNQPLAIDHFIEGLIDPKREAHALASEYPETTHRNSVPEDYLPPVELEAPAALYVPRRWSVVQVPDRCSLRPTMDAPMTPLANLVSCSLRVCAMSVT